jgi:signal transduction histidine kinase
LLFGAQLGPKREDELRFAAKLMQSISPAVYSVYLVRRLRNRIGALERARVARELHDGAIQSLISIEMQVDVMRRKAKLDADLSADLGRIQHLLQKQVLEIRELMQQLRPTDITPQQFVDFLSNTVDRFRRDTGINANFQSDVQEVDLTPLQCRELGRILQEALVNVRKHSGASNVNVNLAPDDGWLLLTIDDDGKGFDFSGRMNSQQLTEAQIGPTIIKDRVRSIAGELEIESAPGQGARLRVALPRKGYR